VQYAPERQDPQTGGAHHEDPQSIVAAGAAGVLGGTAAFLVPAAASAHDATHTLTFTAVAENSVMFTPTTRGVQDTDFNSAGTTIGFDNLYLTFTSATSASGNATLDISGGFLYATIATTNGGQTFSGKVTGGTGAFTGATGAFTGKATNAAGSEAVVTVTYSTENSQG
jgi:hypothetical protein